MYSLPDWRTALARVINAYGREKKILKDADANLTSDDVREGLTAIVSVKLVEPQFEGQTKSKLGNSEIRPLVDGTPLASPPRAAFCAASSLPR